MWKRPFQSELKRIANRKKKFCIYTSAKRNNNKSRHFEKHTRVCMEVRIPVVAFFRKLFTVCVCTMFIYSNKRQNNKGISRHRNSGYNKNSGKASIKRKVIRCLVLYVFIFIHTIRIPFSWMS